MSLESEILLLSAEYSIKNLLLGIYLILSFLFWWFVYSRSPVLTMDKNNITLSITSISIKFICWLWFIVIFYLLRVILFVSRSETFLEDKLFIINSLMIITIIILGLVLIINLIKYLYKLGSFHELYNNLVFELRGQNRK
jgi:hypothetical protein